MTMIGSKLEGTDAEMQVGVRNMLEDALVVAKRGEVAGFFMLMLFPSETSPEDTSSMLQGMFVSAEERLTQAYMALGLTRGAHDLLNIVTGNPNGEQYKSTKDLKREAN